MILRKNELKVFYEGKIQPELDKKIIQFFDTLGFSCWARGVNLDNEGHPLNREIAFDEIGLPKVTSEKK